MIVFCRYDQRFVYRWQVVGVLLGSLMSDLSNKPVIFLAFANDRDDTVGYLRNLPDETRRLREALESAEQAGLCEVVVRSNSTAGDIFKVFQDPRYRKRQKYHWLVRQVRHQ